MDLRGKKVLVTGGNSFLGKSLVPLLRKKEAEIFTFSSMEYDLRKEHEVEKLFLDATPDVVMHLAVDCGGFEYKENNKGKMFYNNIMADTLVQEYSMRNNVEKFVGIGTSASYPEFASSPLNENDLWEGQPEESNHSYGLVKRMMIIQSQAYRDQYGFNSIHLIPVNLYGPNFSTTPKDIRFIPILLRKFVDGKENREREVELSGTRNASREFLYVEDCAEGIIKATELYDKPSPVNLGCGEDIPMGELAEKVKKVVGYAGKIIWRGESSNQTPPRVLDISRAEMEFGFKAKTSLEKGLTKTLEWYLENYEGFKGK